VVMGPRFHNAFAGTTAELFGFLHANKKSRR
jgi:hypothetical protein